MSEEGFKGGDRISIDLPRPEETLRLQGDLAGARKLQEETLNVLRRVLGPEHPDTSISAWNLIRTLQDLGNGLDQGIASREVTVQSSRSEGLA